MKARQNLSDFIVEEIKNKILKGEYKVGDKIPNEFEIAKEYNVSRFTVREAINKLCTAGIVKIERGRGTYVVKVNLYTFIEPFIPMLILDERELKEIYEARLAIERQTTNLAVSNANSEDILKLRSLIGDMELSINQNNTIKYNELDVEYHYAIAEASKNRILCEILKALQDLMKIAIDRVSIAPNATVKSLSRHKAIIECIEKKDHQRAVELMGTHITDSLDYLDKLSAKT